MADFQVKNIDFLRTIDPTGKLYEALKSVQDEVNAQKSQTGATGLGTPSAPNQPIGLTVSAAGGIFQVSVSDNQQGVNYTLEYSAISSFSTYRQIYIGPAMSYRANLGNQMLFWRVRAGKPTSPHGAPLSSPTYFGTLAQPTPVQGGGATIGPQP